MLNQVLPSSHDLESMPYNVMNKRDEIIFDQEAIEGANPTNNFYASLDDLLDEDFQALQYARFYPNHNLEEKQLNLRTMELKEDLARS